MSSRITLRMLERLIPQLMELHNAALALERSFADELQLIEPDYRVSARNLLHYLSLRQHDIRTLQHDLSVLGLSSLGRLEAHTLATLDAVLSTLHQLAGKPYEPAQEPPVNFRMGPMLLEDHTRSLLGPKPLNRSVRIMVTMPTEAADDPQLIQDLLAAGMNVMRLNCAHDGPDVWTRMVANLRQAERVLGRSCKILADLAGPKLRTGAIEAAGRVLKIRPQRNVLGQVIRPANVWLTPTEVSHPAPEGTDFILPIQGGGLANAAVGDEIELTDARDRSRRLRVTMADGQCCMAEAHHVLYALDGSPLTLYRNDERIGQGTIRPLPEVVLPIILKRGDYLILTREDVPGRAAQLDRSGQVISPARIHCSLESAFRDVKPDEHVWFDDGKIGGIVRANDGQEMTIEITHTGPGGAKLRSEKGINFPDSALTAPALTDKDLADLKAVAKQVDMVGLSFVRRPEDVYQLEDHLHALGAGHLGIVLKIENRQAFENLPRLLMASLRSPPAGVMVARGDLAVEVGFERLAEVQEEILWLCEAAHIPVIWATQMLEGMAKGGSPSRAEVTDAAMSSRAECAMLNKGPNIVETVALLSGILERMEAHQSKKTAMLRKLSVSQLL